VRPASEIRSVNPILKDGEMFFLVNTEKDFFEVVR
jgi:hypothetical protein